MSRSKVLATCVVLLAGIAAAQDYTPGIRVLGASERMHTLFDAMPEEQLKAVNLKCDSESSKRRLLPDEVLPCSIAWDALLRRSFGGDFDRLLAWVANTPGGCRFPLNPARGRKELPSYPPHLQQWRLRR